MPIKLPAALLSLFVCAALGCGGDDSAAVFLDASVPAVDAKPILPDACVDGAVTLAVTTPASYVCEANYRATFIVTNGSCAPVTVSSLMISAVVTDNTPGTTCTPPSPGTYPPMTATVGSKQTVTVLDLTGNPFCCFDHACPDPFTCGEDYTFSVATSAGTFTQTVPVSIDLHGCGVICGQ